MFVCLLDVYENENSNLQREITLTLWKESWNSVGK